MNIGVEVINKKNITWILSKKLLNLFHLHEPLPVIDGGGKQPSVDHQLHQRDSVSSSALERLVTWTHKDSRYLPRLAVPWTSVWFCPTAGCIFLVPSLNAVQHKQDINTAPVKSHHPLAGLESSDVMFGDISLSRLGAYFLFPVWMLCDNTSRT